jgi:hypothetical protein
VIEWLREIGLKENIINELASCSFNSFIQVNRISFDSFNLFKENNIDIQNRKCIENKYLIIGSGLNGDPIVYSLKNNSVGYVSHEELWEEEEYVFGEICCMTNLSIQEFYYEAFSDDFPADFYECEEYAENIDSNGNSVKETDVSVCKGSLAKELFRQRLSRLAESVSTKEEWVAGYLSIQPNAIGMSLIGDYNSIEGLGDRLGRFSLKEAQMLIDKMQSENDTRI